MTFYVLDDPEFLGFNFSAFLDPELKPGHGPTQAVLYRLAIKSRRGDRIAAGEFANTLYWKLRPAAFESFQRVHGPRPIEHRDWFCSKLFQFFEILLHDAVEVSGNGRRLISARPGRIVPGRRGDRLCVAPGR
jgi:hypothetical protein